MSHYTIREVDGEEESDVLHELHHLCFFESAEQLDYGASGYWWLAYHNREAIGFAGIVPSYVGDDTGYLKRAGVVYEHRGAGLQRRLIRVREAKAKKLGWSKIVTDTTNNPRSANNLYRAGYKMFTPQHPWAFKNSLYFHKSI